MKQTTLNKSFVIEGIGLHSGAQCRVQINPGEVDSGYQIKVGKHVALVAPWRLDSRHHCTGISESPRIPEPYQRGRWKGDYKSDPRSARSGQSEKR